MIKKLLITLFLVTYLVSPVFASGIIIGWDDTIANIPTGWGLCDGNGGRPNLLDKYLKSVGSAEDPGATGGTTTHTHTSPAHNHTQDAHSHSSTSSGASGSSGNALFGGSTAAAIGHTHSVTLDATTATNQESTVTLDSTSNDPPYYKLAFIYDSGVNRYPVGSVILWNSATLPNGWTTLDGLKNRFAKSVGSSENPGTIGGSSDSHTHTNTAHNHVQDSHSHTSSLGGGSTSGGDTTILVHSPGNHTHNLSSGSTTATNQDSSVTITSADGQPAYYKLLYIKNTGTAANRPKNSIVQWTGTIDNIPNGYVLCDGNNGTPNLLGNFIKGANSSSELGNTGGSATHNHSASSHNHVQDSHSHTVTIGNGNQSNGYGRSGVSGSYVDRSHGHSCSDILGTATNQATTITVDSANSEPPYYKVAFIMQTIDLDVGVYAFITD